MTIIAFISQKGGVGKSTLARALAVEASHKKLRVLLADCDPQQATSYHWLQVRKKSKFKVEIFPTAQQASVPQSRCTLRRRSRHRIARSVDTRCTVLPTSSGASAFQPRSLPCACIWQVPLPTPDTRIGRRTRWLLAQICSFGVPGVR